MFKIPPCGAYCKNCVVYKKKCEGCVETKGKPFHLKGTEFKICPIWDCAMKKKVDHCGLCKEFPCNLFLSFYDPKRGIVTALRRAGLLALRKKLGERKWIKWLKEKKIKFGV
jgi:hypothetical protein